MAHRIKYIMVGGFLGAGKTTALGRLAQHYTQAGLNVGIVTNDQAADLVDTNTLRSQGFDVGEVAGACFCCNFDELMDTIAQLGEDRKPDILLAEPVGSCTDLVATVIQPIKRLFDADFDIAPYSVILKPSHGKRILRNEKGAGFSPKAAYILTKQLEEADAILINRIDELSVEAVQELHELVAEHYPGTPVMRISAKTGTGFEALTELLEQTGDFGRKILDIDYDTYAEGEAELGWLNSSVRVTGTEPFPLDELLLEIITSLRDRLAEEGAETAHLKTIGLWEGFFGGRQPDQQRDPSGTLAAVELRRPRHRRDRQRPRGLRPGDPGATRAGGGRCCLCGPKRDSRVSKHPEFPPGPPGSDASLRDRRVGWVRRWEWSALAVRGLGTLVTRKAGPCREVDSRWV